MGLNITFGTDRMPASPLFGIACAMSALFTNQQLSFADALRYYTETPSEYDESNRGKLEVGRRADVVVFDASLEERMHAAKEILERALEGEDVVDEVREFVAALQGRTLQGSQPAAATRPL